MKGAIERLAELIGYPARVPGGGVSFDFLVDDDPVTARTQGGALQFRWALPGNPPIATVAAFAAGRILREEAVVAWDPATERLILWQGTAKGADDAALVKAFQQFLNSRDWWAERMKELSAPKTKLADLVIHP